MELSKFEIVFPVKYLGVAKVQFHALTLSQPGSWGNIHLENKGQATNDGKSVTGLGRFS